MFRVERNHTNALCVRTADLQNNTGEEIKAGLLSGVNVTSYI
jgi:hypothetical protein